MITRLNIRNFKGCSESFGLAKTNNIIGKNGSGKSTILEAIKIALTGYTEAGKLASKTYQLASDKVMEVSIESDDGQTLSRTFEKSGSGAKQSITLNGVPVKDSELKLPPSMNFSVESIHPSEFIGLSGDKRTEFIFSSLPAEITRIKPEDIAEKMKFFAEPKLISDLLEILKSKKSETDKEIKLCVANIQKLSGEIGELPAGTLQEWEKKKKVAQEKINELIMEISANEERARTGMTRKQQEDRLKSLLKLGDEKIVAAQKEIADLKSKITELEKIDLSHEEKEAENMLLDADLRKKTVQFQILHEKIKLLETRIEKLKDGVCPTCGTKGEALSSMVDEMDIELFNGENEKQDIGAEIEKQKSIFENNQNLLKEMKAALTRNDVRTNKNAQLEMLIRVKQDAIKSYQDSIKNAGVELDSLQEIKLVDPVSGDILIAQKGGLMLNVGEAEDAIKKFVAAQSLRNKKSESETERMKLESLSDTIKSAIESVKKIRDEKMQSIENEIKKPFDIIIESAFDCPAILKLSKGDKPCFEFGVTKNGYDIYFDTLSGGERTVMLAALTACIQKIKDGRLGIGFFELAEADSDTARAFVKAVSAIGFEQIFIASCHGSEIPGANNILREQK